MKNRIILIAAGLLLMGLMGQAAFAQMPGVTVSMGDESQSTTLTANVSEQCRIAVPETITFNVTDVNSPTMSNFAIVDINSIVLSDPLRQLRISVRANASQFTAPGLDEETWSAGDVNFDGFHWMGAMGEFGNLSSEEYRVIATTFPGISSCWADDLRFWLAPKASVRRAGSHTLNMTWKVEAISF